MKAWRFHFDSLPDSQYQYRYELRESTGSHFKGRVVEHVCGQRVPTNVPLDAALEGRPLSGHASKKHFREHLEGHTRGHTSQLKGHTSGHTPEIKGHIGSHRNTLVSHTQNLLVTPQKKRSLPAFPHSSSLAEKRNAVTLLRFAVTTVCPQECPLFCVTSANSFMLAAARAANETSAARRRQRRSGQFLRHERLTVAMLLAERDHHTAPRGQKQAKSGEGEGRNETPYTAKTRETEPPPPPPRPPQPYEERPRGRRPEAFAEPRPQEQVQRHTVERLSTSLPRC